MNKSEVLELKRRLKKDACTFTRMCGCYVDGERNRIVKLEETFLNLDEEEFYKYLEIARKALSGVIGNQLLELEFPLEEEAVGGRQHFLSALKSSALKNPDLLERFYDLIIDNYEYAGNYLILIFHDAYDIIIKTKDKNSLDESEEVYEYLLCAICPVSLSKPALGYRSDENRIGARVRDWVVGAPESGFLFPAFTDRSSDIHAVMTYHKNPKEPHTEFMEGALGCVARRTAAEQKQAFQSIVQKAFGGDEEKSTDAFNEIQQELSDFAAGQEPDEDATQKDPARLSADDIGKLMEESDMPKTAAEVIASSYREEFQDETPLLENLMDSKAALAGSKLRQQKDLVKKVAALEEQLGNTKTYDVILRVKPEKEQQIQSQIINGRKCIVIPMEENEHAIVNGRNTTV